MGDAPELGLIGVSVDRATCRAVNDASLYYANHSGTTKELGAAAMRMGRGLHVANDLAAGRDQYLRPAEAAAFLHVSPQTVRRWASQGKLPFVLTAGGHRRFPRSEVQLLRQRLQAEAVQAVAQVERT